MKLFKVVAMVDADVVIENVLSESKRALQLSYTKAGKEVLKVQDVSDTVFTGSIEDEKERFNNAIADYTEDEQKLLKTYFNVLINDIKA